MASVCLFLTDFTHHDHLKVHPCCVNGILSFLVMAEWYSVVWAHVHVHTHTHPPCIFSVHPSVDGHLLACLGRCEECCCEHGGVGIFSSLILSGCVSRSGAPGPYSSPGCSFLRALYSVSTVAAQSTFPHIFFILLVVDGRLERSHVLTVVNVLL